LPVALDGVYRWVAFLPSRLDARVPVANRYFGIFQDGSSKIRGIEARRQDTPAWVADIQLALLDCLAGANSADELPGHLPEAMRLLRKAWLDLRARRIPLKALVASQKLSKELDDYLVPSPAARAAIQLRDAGKIVKQGQRVRFLYTLGYPGVYAWDLPGQANPSILDVSHYQELLFRAARTLLEPLGVDEETLRDWLYSDAGYFGPPGTLPPDRRFALPLWVKNKESAQLAGLSLSSTARTS
jgi:DNA polymerase-2